MLIFAQPIIGYSQFQFPWKKPPFQSRLAPGKGFEGIEWMALNSVVGF